MKGHFLDSSAIVKLILEEPESGELRAYVREMRLIASEVALAEVLRAVRRKARGPGDPLFVNLRHALGRMEIVRCSRTIIILAGAVGPVSLRTLDALHVASAIRVRNGVASFISYDKRQLEAVRSAGIATATPGRA